MNDLAKKIEALLFFQAEPIKIKKLASLLDCDENSVKIGLDQLENNLEDHGIKMIRNDDSASLTTDSENHELIEKIKKEEQDRELSKAALETLSIVLYRGPLKKSEIDYIRGVNSQFSLRTLLIKGLIEKETSKNDERSYIYKPTIDLLSYLGVSKIENLPEFQKINDKIESFMKDESEKKEDE